MPQRQPKRILVVKLGAIGDVCMALPMITAAKALNPQCTVDWMVGRYASELLRNVDGISTVIEIDDERLLKGSALNKLLALIQANVMLAGRHYDLICVGHSDQRYRLLTLTATSPLRRAFGRGERPWPLPGRHHSGEYVRLVTGIDGWSAISFPPPLINTTLTEQFAQQIGQHQPIVVLAPGGAKNLLRDDALRRWPVGHYVKLAESLTSKGVTVILSGGPGDAHVKEYFSHLKVLDFIGKTTLTELLAILRRSDAVISHDTSIIHLGHLIGIKVVGLFGPTMMEEKLLKTQKSLGIRSKSNIPCSPCYDGKNYFPCDNNICMSSISPGDVLDEISSLMGI